MSTIRGRFGRLRSMMHMPAGMCHPLALWELMQSAAADDPDEYAAEWIPYMRRFPEHFDRPLQTLGSFESLASLAGSHPHARFNLNLSDAPRTAQDLADMMREPCLSQVAGLLLRGNDIDDDGAEVIASAELLAPLIVLSLHENCIGDRGARALANTTCLARLTSLDLGGNLIGDEGAVALAASETLTSLNALGLGGNRVGDEGARALANLARARGLTTLELFDNAIGDAGARELAASTQLTSLTRLTLRGNGRIGRRGAGALARSENLPESVRLEWGGWLREVLDDS